MESISDLFNTRKSFEDVLIMELSALKLMARCFVSEKDKIEDLVQDTIVKALRFYEKFDLDTDIRKWLYTIMKNTFINQVNRNSRKRDHEVLIEIAVKDVFAVNYVFSKMIVDDVNLVIGTFSGPVRKAIELFNAGYKYREIALATAQPIGTVKTRIRTARMALGKKFDLLPIHPKS